MTYVGLAMLLMLGPLLLLPSHLLTISPGDDFSRVNRKAVVEGLRKLQLPDGCFTPVPDVRLLLLLPPQLLLILPQPSESDMRYVYCACTISTMLNDWSGVDKEKATEYILKSQSYDGSIGQVLPLFRFLLPLHLASHPSQGPYEEGHAGSTYCAIASLVMMGTLVRLPHKQRLIRWLIERQSLGFNGRPNKIQGNSSKLFRRYPPEH